MAKFIKFNITATDVANAPKSVLIPLDDITGVVVQANNVLDIHCVGAHAATQLWKKDILENILVMLDILVHR